MKERRYITKIRLYRFQGYTDETVYLGRTTNAIRGMSDSGKSSISRAINWVLYNRPVKAVAEYVAYDEEHCFVTVFFSDNTAITRGRRRDENYYILDKNGKKTEFKGFGFEVPPEITEAHGMPRVVFDDNYSMSLNVGMQNDPVFLFDDSDSRKSKLLGKISGAERMDGGIDVINTWNRTAVAARKDLLARVKKLNESIKAYDYLDDMIGLVDGLEDLANTIDSNQDTKNEIMKLASSYLTLELSKETLLSIILHEPNLLELDKLVAKLESLQTYSDELNDAFSRYEEYQQSKTVSDKLLAQEANIDMLSKHLEDLQNEIGRHQELTEIFNEYTDIVVNLNENAKLIGSKYAIYAVSDLISQIDNMNDIATKMYDVGQLFKNNAVDIETMSNMVAEIEQNIANITEEYEQALLEYPTCPLCSQPLHECMDGGGIVEQGYI